MKQKSYGTWALLLIAFSFSTWLQAQPRQNSWQLAKELQQILTPEQKAELLNRAAPMPPSPMPPNGEMQQPPPPDAPPPPRNSRPMLRKKMGNRMMRGNRPNRRGDNQNLRFLTQEQRQTLRQRMQNRQEEHRIEVMQEALNLNPQQVRQIEDLHQRIQSEREAFRNEMQSGNANQDANRTRMENQRAAHNDAMKNILSEQQYEVFRIHQALAQRPRQGREMPPPDDCPCNRRRN